MKMVKLLLVSTLLILPALTWAQQGGRVSGNLQLNANIFLRDTLIGAANTPQYDHQFFGNEAWMNLNYSNWGFDFGLRFDMFNNSNLLNPQSSYSARGIGRWFVRKKLDRLTAEAGYLYGQIGSGAIFRAWEQRPLGIDNSLFGARVGWEFNENWNAVGFSGVQKQQFDIYRSIISGMNIEGFIVGDSSMVTLAPGLGIVNRTLDDQSMASLVSSLNTYSEDDIFVPVYNTYAFSAYNTLTAGRFNWYIEGAYKTEDNLVEPEGTRISPVTGDTLVGEKLFKAPGNFIYTSLNYATKGLSVTLEGKRTQNFTFRTRPQEALNMGLVNFLPPMTRLNTYRLTARYNAATQDLGEIAYLADIRYAPNRKVSFNVNFSNLQTLEGDLLYREVYTEFALKKKRKWALQTGVQIQNYNQEVYEGKPDAPIVETFTPYVDFLYRLSRKKSVRFEAQYMLTGADDKDQRHDYGDWLFAQVEFSIAPHWNITVSDMYNARPGKNSPSDATGEKQQIHYPRFDVFYTYKASRISLSYIKQVEGVVCSGGVCRLEPAFSGVRLTLNSSF
ncbi:MAG: DUF6029 family protein [Bacteroidota bacterium]